MRKDGFAHYQRDLLIRRASTLTLNVSLLGADGFTALAGLVGQSEGYRFRYGALDDALAFFDGLA